MNSNKRRQSLIQLGLFLGILIFINILGASFYTHLDLTEDRRFSLTPATKKLVKELDDNLFATIYLDGEFSSDVKRLQSAVVDMLEKFKSLSPNVEYRFQNPLDGDPDAVAATLKNLKERGIYEYVDKRSDSDEFSARRVFPGATLYYKGREISVYFLERATPGMPKEVRFNNSISLLEYGFANAVKKLQTIQKPKIAFIAGHGELRDFETADFEASLQPFYDLARLNLDSVTVISDRIGAIVVAKPRGPFSRKDKFKLDQYVMNGGKVLWLIDRMDAGLDSLRTRPEIASIEMPLELDDLLSRYGAFVNPDLIMDLQCTRIPLQVGMVGEQAQFDLKPWYFYPVIIPDFDTDHPITKSLDGIEMKFASSIQLKKTKTEVQSTVLLSSSENATFRRTPVRLSFDMLRYPPQPERFNNGGQPVAVLLEGVFPSLYENRVTDAMMAGLKELGQEFKTVSKPTRQIVIADGDIARNPVDLEKRELKPLGFNAYERYTFANKEFLLNCIEYLMDKDGLIGARSKEVKLRLLDKTKLKERSSLLGIPMAEKTKRQVINLVFPILILLLFGLGYNYLRKRRFAL